LHSLNHSELLDLHDNGGPWVNSVAYSPDGSQLAVAGCNPFSANAEAVVQVYHATSGQLRWRKTGLLQMIYQVAYSPDGRHLASAGGTWAYPGKGELQVWDAATGEQVRRFPEDEAAPIIGLAFSPDGGRLATSSLDKTIRVWDVSSGREVRRSEYQVVRRSVTFSP